MIKKEKRIAVLAQKDFLYGICVFRGHFLEHLFLDKDKDRLLETYARSPIRDEAPTVTDEESYFKSVCETILDRLSQKINKVKT